MTLGSNRQLWAGAAGAALSVYREIRARAQLLAGVLRRDDLPDPPFEDTLVAFSEHVSIPEPLLRSKAG